MAINWNEVQQPARGPSPSTRISRVLRRFVDALKERGYVQGNYILDENNILHYPEWKFSEGLIDIGYAANVFSQQPITDIVLIRCIEIERAENTGKGIGRKVLGDLTAIADEQGVKLLGVVDPDYFNNRGLNETQICDWLERNGFDRWLNHGLLMRNPALPVYIRRPANI